MELKDLIPFIDPEVLKRWTELQETRDWDLVDWTKPKTFTDLANIVRNSGLGGDVREALAKMYEEVAVMVGAGANEEQARQILDLIGGRIKKGEIEWSDFTQNVREILNGDRPLPIVGEGAVGNVNVIPQSLDQYRFSFINPPRNLINIDDVVVGEVASKGGGFDPHVDYIRTNYVPVYPKAKITSRGVSTIAFYTQNLEYIARIDAGWNSLATTAVPDKAYFAIFNINRNQQNEYFHNNTVQANFGDVLYGYTDYSAPEMKGITITDFKPDSIYGEAIKGNQIDTRLIKSISHSDNLIDESKITYSYLISTNGEETHNASYGYTDYIAIRPNTWYSHKSVYSVAFYDSDFKFIRRENALWSGGTFKTKGKDAFVRLNMQKYAPNRTELALNVGETLKPYDRYNVSVNNSEGLGALNKVLEDSKDRYMIDVPFDKVFHGIGSYPNYTDYKSRPKFNAQAIYALYDELQRQHPDYISVEVLGQDDFGNDLKLYTFKPTVARAELETRMPKIFITSGTHGQEPTGVFATYHAFKHIVNDWKTSQELEALRFNVEFMVIPLVNPSGWNRIDRRNENRVDLNRNFPANWSSGTEGTAEYGGTAPATEKETKILMGVFEKHTDIDAFYDFHNYGTDVNEGSFLWLISNQDASTQHMWQNLCGRMARKWAKEYEWLPDDYHIAGYTSTQSGGLLQTYAKYRGIKYVGAMETCYAWRENTSGEIMDSTVVKTATETLVNWLLINLREICR